MVKSAQNEGEGLQNSHRLKGSQLKPHSRAWLYVPCLRILQRGLQGTAQWECSRVQSAHVEQQEKGQTGFRMICFGR